MTERRPIVTIWTIALFVFCYYWQPQNFDTLCFGFLCYYLGRIEDRP